MFVVVVSIWVFIISIHIQFTKEQIEQVPPTTLLDYVFQYEFDSMVDNNSMQSTLPQFIDALTDLPEINEISSTNDVLSTVDECINDVGIVSNVSFDLSTTGILASWNPPENYCVYDFIIYLNNKTNQIQSATTVNISNLNSCQNYSIGIQAIYRNETGAVFTFYAKTLTPKTLNYAVQELNTNIADEGYFNIFWVSKPSIMPCIKTYKLKITDFYNNSYYKAEIRENYYNFSFIGCNNYTISITPKISENNYGITLSKIIASPTIVLKPPKAINISSGRTDALIQFERIFESNNRCKANVLYIECKLPYKNYTIQYWNDISQLNWNTIPLTNISNLTPFTNYSCSASYFNEAGESEKSKLFSVNTKESVPSEPQWLKFTNVTSNSFEIMWEKPSEIPGILRGYNLRIKSDKMFHYIQSECVEYYDITFSLVPEKVHFIFKNALPDLNYIVFVNAETGAGAGPALRGEVITESGKPGMPENVTLANVDESSFDISFVAPCNTNGPLKMFRFNCSGYYFEEDEFTPLVQYANKIYYIDQNANVSNVHYEAHFENMSASSFYSIDIQAILINNIEGEIGTINLTTITGYPSPPILEDFININSFNFEITWRRPFPKNGKILEYGLSIEALEPLYYIPKGCGHPKQKFSYSLNGDEYQFVFNKALPWSNYSIMINASTSAGFGNFSQPRFVQTESFEPESIRNLMLTKIYSYDETYEAVAKISFDYPCFTNGFLKNFTILYTGTRNDYPDHEGQTCLMRMKSDHLFDEISIRPEHDYTFQIVTYTERFYSRSPKLKFHSKAGVPPPPAKLPLPKSCGATTAQFNLSKTDFNNNNGEIVHYSLIVAEIQAKNRMFFGFWDGDNITWPTLHGFTNKIVSPYEITPQFWNPFKNQSINSILVTIGIDKNCTMPNHCNKPLRPNTKYSLIVRIFTYNSYRDSSPLDFTTDDEENKLKLVFLIALFVLLICAVFLSVVNRKLRTPFIMEEKKEKMCMPDATPSSIELDKFIEYYNYVTENYHYIEEQFELLNTKTKEMALPSTYAILPENKRKNRYFNILPYDETRVKLIIDEDDEIASDYINASKIKGLSGNVEYIATQGPLATTFKDFWKMILQENISIIVMVAQFIENNKEKCFKYFPNNHENMKLGDNFEIRCSTELHFGIYCIRTLQVKRDNKQRTVIHMQFLEWPDFGVPSGTEHMLQFCQQMRERITSEGGIILVHCSAGVGRTGTLISLDMLFQIIKAKRSINIFKTVMDLRKQRTHMVQTEQQYMYVHTCVKDAIENPIPTINDKKTEPLYENLEMVRSSLEENLLPIETESIL